MYALRKFLYKPKKTDTALLAQFYYANEDLCLVAAELDSLDGRKHPAKCAALVAQLRQYQDQVLKLIQSMMDETVNDQRASRDFRVKYPDDLLQDGLLGQLWFGAECLAAGSSILNREVESESMRPLAKSLTKQIEQLRQLLRDQSLRDPLDYSDRIKQAFVKFDETFAEFELSYVSAMVPVKTMREYDMTQDVTVLFSETVVRAIRRGFITSDMLEYYDPGLMFTIPRLAIVCGLIIFPEGPLNPDSQSQNMSEMFRPFQSLLKKIRQLLWSLSQDELLRLERLLCNLEEPIHAPASKSVCTNKPTRCCSTKHTKNQHTRVHQSGSSLFSDITSLNDINRTVVSNSSGHLSNSILESLRVTDNEYQGDRNVTGVSRGTFLQSSPGVRENQILNDQDTGVARLYVRVTDIPDTQTNSNHISSHNQSSTNESRYTYSDPQSSSTRNTSTTSTPSDFVFTLPSNDGNHNVRINRSLSQDGSAEDRSRPVALLDQTINSDSASDSTLSSDSDMSLSSMEQEQSSQDQLLMQDLLDVRSDIIRSKYKSTEELIQKLFVCVSGVADQLQTNFASDLRHILKSVFDLHTYDLSETTGKCKKKAWESNISNAQSPPTWIPDSEMDKCCSCKMPFTIIRRRHHCRNCGLIFCGRCSSNSAPLPNYGYERAVRICNKCYIYRVNPFYMDQTSPQNSIGGQSIGGDQPGSSA